MKSPKTVRSLAASRNIKRPIATQGGAEILVGGAVHHMKNRESLQVATAFEFTTRTERIPQLVEQLKLRGRDSDWLAFMFYTAIRSPVTDDQCLNLQYSVAGGVIGLDWVLLGERNAAERRRITQFAQSRGHNVMEHELNEVAFLRVEDGDLPALGQAIVRDAYQIPESYAIGFLSSCLKL